MKHHVFSYLLLLVPGFKSDWSKEKSWQWRESNPRPQHRRLHLYPLLHRWLLSRLLFLVWYKKCVSCFKFHILYQTLPELCVTRCMLRVSGFLTFIVTGFSFWTLECFLLHVSSFMSCRRKGKNNRDCGENRTPEASTEDFISIHYSTGGCLANPYF